VCVCVCVCLVGTEEAAEFNERAAFAEEAKDRELSLAREKIGALEQKLLEQQAKGRSHDASHNNEDDECGIGAFITCGSSGVYQVAHIESGGPAAASGVLHVGMVVRQIDGISVHGRSSDEVSSLLVGPANTLVELEVEDEAGPRRVAVRRGTEAGGRTSQRGGPRDAERLAQLENLVMGMTRQVESRERSENALRQTLALKEAQIESSMQALARVNVVAETLALSLGVETEMASAGWEKALQAALTAAKALISHCRCRTCTLSSLIVVAVPFRNASDQQKVNAHTMRDGRFLFVAGGSRQPMPHCLACTFFTKTIAIFSICRD
jgi:hypothetical protein